MIALFLALQAVAAAPALPLPDALERQSLPARADAAGGVMDCDKLQALGWRPGGWPRLRATLAGWARQGVAEIAPSRESPLS